MTVLRLIWIDHSQERAPYYVKLQMMCFWISHFQVKANVSSVLNLMLRPISFIESVYPLFLSATGFTDQIGIYRFFIVYGRKKVMFKSKTRLSQPSLQKRFEKVLINFSTIKKDPMATLYFNRSQDGSAQ